MQRSADLISVLSQQQFPTAAGHPVQFGAHVEQCQMRLAQRADRRGQRAARIDVGELRDRQGVEQLHVAKAAATALQIGLGAVGDLTAALPPRLGVLDEFVETRSDSGAPLPTGSADQQRRQVGVARNVPGLEHGQARRDVLARDLHRLGHRAHAVVDANVRVPQRVPQQFSDLTDDVVRHVVVQQHQIEVRVRQQLSPPQPTGGDDREPTGGGDPDLGCLCGEPEIVQVQQRVA